MDTDDKRMLGKLLGELYRMQRRLDPKMCGANDATVYGLLNGFEQIIDEELEDIGWTPADVVTAVQDVLQPYFDDRDKLVEFGGFYDLEDGLRAAGITRGQAIAVLKFLNAGGAYASVIAKLDSDGSPIECRKFDLDDFEK